jgi:hypothetical protein
MVGSRIEGNTKRRHLHREAVSLFLRESVLRKGSDDLGRNLGKVE